MSIHQCTGVSLSDVYVRPLWIQQIVVRDALHRAKCSSHIRRTDTADNVKEVCARSDMATSGRAPQGGYGEE